MKKQMLAIIACLAAGVMIVSCSKNDKQQKEQPDLVSDEILAQINAYGLSTDNVRKIPDGYLVEGDILLTVDQLKEKVNSTALRVGQVEQYRASRLVTGLPRTITVKIVGLGSAFAAGVDTALWRYNRLGLRFQFVRIASGNAMITIDGFSEAPVNGHLSLAYSGFPTSTGDPYSSIRVNYHPAAFGSSPNVLYVGSVIQHEMGHCLGMHHTDYMDRSFSCGGSPVREGITPRWIPGTPTGPDANSWMLACSNGGNRPFNSNDIIALKYLYQ